MKNKQSSEGWVTKSPKYRLHIMNIFCWIVVFISNFQILDSNHTLTNGSIVSIRNTRKILHALKSYCAIKVFIYQPIYLLIYLLHVVLFMYCLIAFKINKYQENEIMICGLWMKKLQLIAIYKVSKYDIA